MKHLKLYKDILKCKNKNEVFNYLLNNLKSSTRVWTYFVNWDKVFAEVESLKMHLNLLNSLIGTKDFDGDLKVLIKKYPEVITAIPSLVVRDGENSKKLEILVDYKHKKFVYEEFDFNNYKNLKDVDIKRIITFVEKTGVKRLFVEQKIKNVVDYLIGVEAGLDSNGRKNRGGDIMEEIVEFFIADICKKNKYSYLCQADAKRIKKEFGYEVPVDKSSRRYDFVINTGKKLYIIETNFYSGGGSKLKATAGEYKGLQKTLSKTPHRFIWITDGIGWKTTAKPLRETFNNNDCILSLAMLEKGILDMIIAG